MRKEYTKKAVSPAIGVVLMVTIVVILAGLVSTGVISLADEDIENQPSGVFSYDLILSEGDDAKIKITLTAYDRLDGAEVKLNGNEVGSFSKIEVGESLVVDYGKLSGEGPIEEGDRITVTGEYGDSRKVISTFSVSS